jgi:hypothetical protein
VVADRAMWPQGIVMTTPALDDDLRLAQSVRRSPPREARQRKQLSGESATSDQVLADSASLDTQTLIFTAAGEYRFVENPRGSLDALAGARVWAVDTEVSVKGGVIGASDDETWVDPVVGLRGRLNMTEKFYLSGWAMIGG